MNQPKTHAIRQGRYYYHPTAIRTKVFSLSLCLLIGMIGIGELAWGQTTDVYPKPVSEYAEQTGPGQMTFLAYPKYYRDANNQLTEVNTTLSVSSDPDWDYEVTSGIWSLSVRKDGTFQARHAGDTFTYQFDSLGIDRGSGFQPLDLGKANFSQMAVAGDTVTWQNVVAGVDLKVRYIHDILKVDVVVKKETMGRIKTSAQRGELNPDTYLTARFTIPSVMITSQAKRGNENADIYAERLDLGAQPLRFEKNGQTIHKLRPVETYLLDDAGQPIEFWNNDPKPGNEINIHCAQAWQLKPNQPGLAEMSARLDDLVNLPDGDVVIDPSWIFSGPGFYGGEDIYDTYLDAGNLTGQYGNNSTMQIGNVSGEKRILVGVAHTGSELPQGSTIQSAILDLYCSSMPNTSQNIKVRAYKVTESWYSSTVSWLDNGFNNPPDTYWYGGTHDSTGYMSPAVSLPVNLQQYAPIKFSLDITSSFKSHFITSTANPGDKGFLIKLDNTPNPQLNWTIIASENSATPYRPKVTVEYANLEKGNHLNINEYNKSNDTYGKMKDDHYNVTRLFAGGNDPYPYAYFLYQIKLDNDSDNNKLKVILDYSCGDMVWTGYDNEPGYGQDYSAGTPEAFSTYINWRLSYIQSEIRNYLSNQTWKISDVVCGVEIGNEEDARSWSSGTDFAEYFHEASTMLRNNWKGLEILGFSLEDTRTIGDQGNVSQEFLEDFIDGVKSLSNGKVDFLPDTLTIHSYTGHHPPEHINTPVEKSHLKLLETIYNICKLKNYFPNFANTEFGYCASWNSSLDYYHNPWAAINASEISQAIYYMRNILINSTMMPVNGLGWKYNMYYHHPLADSKVDGGLNVDFSFFDADQNNNWIDRKIRTVTRFLFNPNSQPSIKLNAIDNLIWIPVNYVDDDPDDYAWCGWQNSDGQKWGAIWRYEPTDTFNILAPSSRTFLAKGNYDNHQVTLYKFYFSNTPLVLSSIGTVTVPSQSFDGVNTPITITTVDANPTFIKF